MRLMMMLVHSFLMTSTRTRGRRSPRPIFSDTLGLGQIHRHFHQSGVNLEGHMLVRISKTRLVISAGQAFIIEYVSSDMPPIVVLLVEARQESNSPRLGGALMLECISSRMEDVCPDGNSSSLGAGSLIALKIVFRRSVGTFVDECSARK